MNASEPGDLEPEKPEAPNDAPLGSADKNERQHGGIALNKPAVERIPPSTAIEPPESHEVGRADWKTMLLAGFAFLVITIILAVVGSSNRNIDLQYTATLVPGVAAGICLLYGLWKLMRLQDRTAKEERMLGFIAIFILSPILLQTFFIPLAIVLALSRPTTRPSAKGKFLGGALMGCGAMFFVTIFGIAVICGFIR